MTRGYKKIQFKFWDNSKIIKACCRFCAIYVLLQIIIVWAVVYTKELHVKEPLSIINESIDVFALFINAIIVYGCCRDIRVNQEVTTEHVYFLHILMLNALGLFLDFFAWRIQGIAVYRQLNFAINTLYYFVGPMAIYMFWKYCLNTLPVGGTRLTKWCKIIQNSIIVLTEIAVILNCFMKFYFDVDSNGMYSRNPDTFVLNALPNVMMILLTVFYILRSEENIKYKIVLSLYGLLPVLTSIVQIFFFGISVLFAVGTCVLIVVYVDFHLRKNVELLELKVKIMHSQIQPHFIVNGMSSIRGLIRKSPEDAIEMMNYFIGYMRCSLDISEANELIPIEKELEFVKDYLEIETMRFSGKIKYSIETENEHFLIPPISIQPLVENAIRHGIRKRKDGCGTVNIYVTSEEKNHVITIEDDGVGFEKLDHNTKESHIGIVNTRKRIKRMLNGTLIVLSKKDIGTKVQIIIPKKYSM